jgi:hypothetical protein
MAAKPRLDGFEFVECLGRGAFGEVWRAYDLTLKTFRAIKIVPRDAFRERDARGLLAEARALAQLPHHRNRVSVHYAKDGVTNFFLMMDYVAGGPLSRLTAPGQPMPWPQAVRYVAGAGDGLLEVHQRGLLHRDIKPANLLLDAERDEAVLGDFGLAAVLDGPDSTAGTPGYIAPEVRRSGQASPRSDVYALAASLLHLVTGRAPRPPVDAEPTCPGQETSGSGPAGPTDVDVATSAGAGPATPWPADVPEEVRAVIAAGMEPDPERRVDLRQFLGMLREARWQRLAEQVLRDQPREPAPVRLQAAVAVARADAPDGFTPLSPRELPRRRLRTGDLVRLESVASADGYQTILLLGSSGDLDVVLPRPNAEGNFFAAGQPHRLLLRLSPPDGRERILVVWSRGPIRRSARAWQQWLEGRGEGLVPPAPQPPRGAVRALEVLSSAPGLPPQGSWRALVISLAHGDG